jgi:predicted hydrolase (HD superfamily)
MIMRLNKRFSAASANPAIGNRHLDQSLLATTMPRHRSGLAAQMQKYEQAVEHLDRSELRAQLIATEIVMRILSRAASDAETTH